jgi:hypothetical protein
MSSRGEIKMSLKLMICGGVVQYTGIETLG